MPLLRRRGNPANEPDTRNCGNCVKSDENVGWSAADASNTNPTNSNDGTIKIQPSDRSATGRPDTSHIQPDINRQRRFSVLKFRNASDSQLSLKAKQQAAEHLPPLPTTPAIITTAPTNEFNGPRKVKSRLSLAAAKLRRSNDIPRENEQHSRPKSQKQMRKSFNDIRGRPTTASLAEPQSPPPESRTSTASNGTALTMMAYRQSESSRSDVDSIDNACFSSPNTTPKKTPTSSIFRLRRIKKAPEPLFPVSHLPQKSKAAAVATSSTSLNIVSVPRPASSQSATTPRPNLDGVDSNQGHSAVVALRAPGIRSGQSSPTRVGILRDRSSTFSSLGRNSTDDHLAIPPVRTSTSVGRKSFGDLFGLSRLRQNTDLSRQGTLTPITPGSAPSQNNSLQLNRDTVILPERKDDESATKYLGRLEVDFPRGIIAASLAKSTDSFIGTVLRSYMRRFSFFGDPMDMALRKLLMQAELPKETQQIDRFLQAFANRYHECNPGIYSSPDQAYFLAFSLLILHTDVFNKNNKHKMQKSDYIKNTRGEGIFDDILECFYDNITYTPFIHVEDDLDLNGVRNTSTRPKRKPFLTAPGTDTAARAAKEPIDPYTLIFDGNLDPLRPNWKDTMYLEDQFNYLGTASCLNMDDLQKTFFRTGVLQIVSARSRPDAFMSEKTAINPDDAPQGIVDIKITKVGLLWRKDAKKRKTRSPWQEWGAILTGAQLYFFRDTSWVKGLMHQHENHIKAGHDGIPITFNPPLHEFKPDALMSTHDAVALMDVTYKKHKNAFVYVRQEGLDEVLLADNEDQLNDWLAKLNYAAAFSTSGVKMRGLVGGNYDGQGRRGIRRLDNSDGTQLVQTPTGPVTIARGRIDQKMAEDIQIARREFMLEKISQLNRRVEEAQKQLEEQLRNARHLQILAPIQPRTRDHLLSAAARMSAQLKWTRMQIWKETCHRDILLKDLNEEFPKSPSILTLKKQHSSEPTSSSTPTPKSTACVAETRSTKHSEIGTITSTEPSSSCIFTSLETLKNSEALKEHEVDFKYSNGATSLTRTPNSSTRSRKTHEQDKPTPRNSDVLDDMDAEERDLLRQTGLLETKMNEDARAKSNLSAAADPAITTTDRDKLEKTTLRRSLQRTLRESAGNISHHISKKGKETDVKSEVTALESTLSRATGSFVVHGKKASVIDLGTEIQNISNDDKIIALKLQHKYEGNELPPPPSPTGLSFGGDEDFNAATELRLEGARRESAASANTATAMSFRELHRKYSSAQAARVVSSGGGRVMIHSDGESEAAMSFSDDQRSSLLPAETESEEDGAKAYASHEGAAVDADAVDVKPEVV